ncbi:maleylpyruvate isomerase family mycothiol-dependent enzyme [Nocardioides sp. R-C-SC26]|uniref:maleylpyruvate isomerase family mycothiol-dependent enzyme n=1 Tax=Nocardioides sp. R-C-SC26 TaxID=2870414 RepID=UPI001E353D34|nr:maleylpyruvate isomerase family mycothiol-dependent enzyme [Nocardioides sp. R-C-SC26]
MVTPLPPARHLTGLHEAMTHFARDAARAGLDVEVPTCPEWTVRRLIGHQGAVHRWAHGALLGTDLEWAPLEKQGRSSADPIEWLRDGAIDLVTTLVAAADDVEAPVFLLEAPPAKQFWTRRQCHETTIHAVDALAATLGRPPRAEETWIGSDLALDGVDELLCGFVPREKSRLRATSPVTLGMVATDVDHGWTVHITAQAPVTTRVSPDEAAAADAVLTGTASQLYLALWHRSDELTSDIWPLWHDSAVH